MNTLTNMKTYFILLLCLLAKFSLGKDVNILDFGAVPDGNILATEAIQKAIDYCESTGGGTVTVPPGTYLTKTIFLKSKVNLNIQKGAILLGDADPEGFDRAIVFANNIQDAAITGLGTIDGQGRHYAIRKNDHEFFRLGALPGVTRHNNILLYRCKNISVEDVSLINSPVWTFRIRECDGIVVRGVRIYSFSVENNDGIDIDGKNITVSDCIIDSDDDAVCLKSDNPDFIVENISITNCVISSNCNAIKFGTASHGGFRNVTINNCVIKRPSEAAVRMWSRIKGVTSDTTGTAGLALEVVDGGFMEQIAISNISMTGIQTPLFIRLGSRNGIGTLKNVLISNITATNESMITSSITGIPGSYVENIMIRDIIFNYKGTGTMEDVMASVPEKENSYPAHRMFGHSLPAYGLYVRHVKNLSLENFRLNLLAPDSRPAVILDDCHNIRLSNFDVDSPENGQPLIRCMESTNILISGYQSIKPVTNFLRIEGEKSSDIKLMGNDFSRVESVFDLSKECKPDIIKDFFNIVK